MADHSAIEWTDATWNPVTGCAIVSPGCTHCYAMKLAGTRLKHHPSRAGLTADSKAGPVWTGEVRLNEGWLDQPLRWKRSRRIFVCAHGDLFAEGVPDAWIDRVFAVMAEAHWHVFQVLTKRSARMRSYLADPATIERIGAIQRRDLGDNFAYTNVALDAIWPLPNVWLGVSAEDQKRADGRIPDLLATPAAVRFISGEPLLGPIDLTAIRYRIGGTNYRAHALDHRFGTSASGFVDEVAPKPQADTKLDWVIVGGESGDGARPMHPDWVRDIRDDCADAGVAFFFKQWGEWAPGECADHLQTQSERTAKLFAGRWLFEEITPQTAAALHYDEEPDLWRMGKRRAGRLLDGVEHNAMPLVRP